MADANLQVALKSMSSYQQNFLLRREASYLAYFWMNGPFKSNTCPH